ncbi:MAG: biotin/lipoyl-containing protein [Eubacteriales bacterium]
MKLYNITVNGTQYEVEVEEVSSGNQAARVYAPAPAAPVAAPVAPAPKAEQPKKAEEAPKAAPAAAPSQGAYAINAPIPGTILDVKVAVGDVIKNGQLILILEAMKMENEIFAAQAGTVETIQVSKGDSVNAGDLMVSLK